MFIYSVMFPMFKGPMKSFFFFYIYIFLDSVLMFTFYFNNQKACLINLSWNVNNLLAIY